MKSAWRSGDAEGQGAGPAALVELLEGVSGPGLGGDVSGELLLVEAGVAPGDVPVVHLVRDAEVPEAAEEVLLDALHEVAAVDEVLLAEGEEVAPSVRSGVAVRPSRNFGRKWSMRRLPVGAAAWWTSASGSRCWPVQKPSRASGRILRKVSQDCCRMRPRTARRQPRPQRARCSSMDAAAARW
jgi:hypothetical protein